MIAFYPPTAHTPSFLQRCEKWMLQWWWTAVFFLICLAAYENAAQSCNQEIRALQRQLIALDREKVQLIEYQQDLQLQVQSESDPAWVELALIKGLGLVPEGQHKVYFE